MLCARTKWSELQWLQRKRRNFSKIRNTYELKDLLEIRDEIEKEFEGKGYGDFKKDVAEAVVEEIRPIRERYDQLSNDKQYLIDICEKGAFEASKIAGRTLNKVYKKVGFVL